MLFPWISRRVEDACTAGGGMGFSSTMFGRGVFSLSVGGSAVSFDLSLRDQEGEGN